MRRVLPATLCLLALAACTGPRTLPYKPGADTAQLERDQLACQAEGAKTIPVDRVYDRTPEWTSPRHTVCNDGHCHTEGGETHGGTLITYDANKDLRDRVVMQCMSDKGYAPTTLRSCASNEVGTAVPAAALPDNSANACYRRDLKGHITYYTITATQ